LTDKESISEALRYDTETVFRPSSFNRLLLLGKLVSAILIIRRDYISEPRNIISRVMRA